VKRHVPWLLFGLLACAPAATDRPPVMIAVLDAAHAAHLGSYGGPPGLTPQLDALAARATRFSRAVANANWTLPSTACLMTGRYQEQHAVVSRWHRVDDGQALLAEQLSEAGYRTGAWVQMPYAGEAYGFGRGFDEFHYYGEGRASELREGGLPLLENLSRWMEAVQGELWFAYVHLRRPHSPYDPPPAILRRLDPDGPLSDGSRDAELRIADTFGHRTLPEEQRARAEVLYRANLAAVDGAAGPVFAQALAQGALLFVTADHGEALGLEGVFGHGIHLADDNVDVPLLVAGPGVASQVRDELVCTVDLWPTLCEWLGLELPPGAAGRSYAPALRGGPRLPPREPLWIGGKHGLHHALQVAAVEGDRKWVLEADGTVAAFERTGSGDRALADDPGLATWGPRLREYARAHGELYTTDRVSEELSPELRLDLERLGYSDGAPAQWEPGHRALSPTTEGEEP
jgi:arylsulfatase A-like enzyme